MSHLEKIKSKVELTDLSVIEKAVQKLGGTLVRNQTQVQFYRGQKAKSDHAIKFPGTSYEIAVNKKKDGTGFELEADLYCQTLSAKVGDGCKKLFQRYRAEELKERARKSGFEIEEKTLQSGQVRLVFSKN